MSERHPHRKKRLSSKRLKDAGVVALGALVGATRRMPAGLMGAVLGALRLAAPVAYYAPKSPFRQAARDLALIVRGKPDGGPLFRATIDRIVRVACLLVRVDRGEVDGALESLTWKEGHAERLRALHAERGGGIVLVPHCVASILALARLGRTIPITLLYVNAPTPARDRIQVRFLDALGIEHVPIRHTGERTVARTIIRATKERRFVVGAADINRKKGDAVAVPFLGDEAWLPEWPGRFATRLDLPIVPAYAALDGDRFACRIDDPVVEKDVAAATRGWAAALERFVRAVPEEWGFLYDKRWSAFVRRAAARAAGESPVAAG